LQPKPPTIQLAETLLAVTLAAKASVLQSEWDEAAQLLRRRDQLLTQLERCEDIACAEAVLRSVQRAESELMELMESCTRNASQQIAKIQSFRARGRNIQSDNALGRLVERFG
jgi:hypothetical protein